MAAFGWGSIRQRSLSLYGGNTQLSSNGPACLPDSVKCGAELEGDYLDGAWRPLEQLEKHRDEVEWTLQGRGKKQRRRSAKKSSRT